MCLNFSEQGCWCVLSSHCSHHALSPDCVHLTIISVPSMSALWQNLTNPILLDWNLFMQLAEQVWERCWGTGGVPSLPTQLQLQRTSIYTLKRQTRRKSRQLRPGETGMELWAGGWRAWQMKGAVMDGVVATVSAKAEKETKETGYGCWRRLICYIPASIYEFLLMCYNTNIGNYVDFFFFFA